MIQRLGYRIASIAIVSASLLCASAQCHAQSSADVSSARDLFKEAGVFAQKGDWEKARKAYAKSLQLKRATITLYSIGVAEKNSGHLIDALEHFRAFLADPSTPGTQPYEQPARDAIVELAKRAAHILVKIDPAAARVTIDGVEVPSAALELPRLVDPGSREIAASAKGYLPAKQVVVVAEGASTSVTLKLELAPPDAIAPIVIAPPAPTTPPDTAPLAPRVDRPNRTIPFALMGGGAGVLVVGVIVGLVGVSEAHSAPTKDGPEASAAKTKALVGDILGVAGIAAAGIGVYLFATGKPKTHEAAWSVTPWASGDTAGVRLRY